MNDPSWTRIKSIFHASLERPPSQRAAFVRGAAQGNAAIIAEVESLLQSATESEFLEHPVIGSREDPLPAIIGRRIGAYRIVRELGRGGMGAVYLAVRDDDAYRKQVAIKIVALEAVTSAAIDRFRHERQILADLDHPNIARLLDGGTTADGVPFVVMEYVDGVPIDRFIVERSLSISERLRLFIQVCAAVHYAHQRLVIHRDLKPGNILVTGDGVPKLLDFGIAKLLGGGEVPPVDVTVTALRMLTPECASPEQVRGEPVTTASDGYALGVLLYRILTDRGPYATAQTTPHAVARAICDEDPRRPSDVVSDPVVARRLRGDLDTIVLKALQKEPARRYASVEQLAQDVRCHLENQPVLAQPDSWRYRAVKFVARQKAAAAAAALVAISLVGGIVATTWQAHVARTQRNLAEQRFNDVRQLTNSFLFDFHDAIERLPGATPARQLVVGKAVEYLDHLARETEAGANVDFERELVAAYIKLGDVQGKLSDINLGQSANALVSYRKALKLAMHIPAGRRVPDDDRQIALAHFRLGDGLRVNGDSTMALEEYETSLAIYERIAGGTRRLEDRVRVADVQEWLARLSLDMGRVNEALTLNEAAASIYRDALTAKPEDDDVQHALAVAQSGVADAYERLANWAASRESSRDALMRFEKLANRHPDDTRERRGVAAAAGELGRVLRKSGDAHGAVRMQEKALAADEALLALDRGNPQLRRDHAIASVNLAEALADAGRPADAYANFARAEREISEVERKDPENARLARQAAACELTFGRFLLQIRHRNEALDHLRLAERMHTRLLSIDHADADLSVDLAHLRSLLARAYHAFDDAGTPNSSPFRSGCDWYESSLRLFEQLRAEQKLAPEDEADVSEAAAGVRACHGKTRVARRP